MIPLNDIRLAIIGCGAVTEFAHLPASTNLVRGRVTLLVDTNPARLDKLSKQFSVPHTAADYRSHLDEFDAAIVALPHSLHARASIELLERGKPVLVEKPMANNLAECDAMIRAAEQSGAVLAIGLMRRFLWGHRFAHELITSGVLGPIRSFNFQEGYIYSWPVASDFFFRKETAGGGVLIDTGAHTLDCLLHWLGDFAEVEYCDDAEGGVEANCVLKLRMQSGACGTVELSRTRELRGTAIVRGELGVLEIGLSGNYLRFSRLEGLYSLDGLVSNMNEPNKQQDYLRTITEQLADWKAAICERRSPMVDGRSARSSIRLIETCYLKRQPLVLQWENNCGSFTK